jgi:hypothetical protein
MRIFAVWRSGTTRVASQRKKYKREFYISLANLAELKTVNKQGALQIAWIEKSGDSISSWKLHHFRKLES